MTASAPTKLGPWGIALFGCWCVFIGVHEIIGRLEIHADGTIIQRQVTDGSRWAAVYTLAKADGTRETLVSGCTDLSLSRNMPVGSQLVKQKNTLSYALDGRTVSDFPLGAYIAWLAGGLFLLVISGRIFLLQRKV